jgi:hypothetical protein
MEVSGHAGRGTRPGDMTLAGGSVAEHGATSTVEGPGAVPVSAATHDHEHFNGRPISWVGVIITCLGFLVGGIAFFISPIPWWLFWTGAGVAVVGCIVLAFAKTFTQDWY